MQPPIRINWNQMDQTMHSQWKSAVGQFFEAEEVALKSSFPSWLKWGEQLVPHYDIFFSIFVSASKTLDGLKTIISKFKT